MSYRNPPENYDVATLDPGGGRWLEHAQYIILLWSIGAKGAARARWSVWRNQVMQKARSVPSGERVQGGSYNWMPVAACAGLLAGNEEEKASCRFLLGEFIDRQINPNNPHFMGLHGWEVNSTTYVPMTLAVFSIARDHGVKGAYKWLDQTMALLSVFRCENHWQDRNRPRVWSPGMRCTGKTADHPKDVVDGNMLASCYAALIEGGNCDPGWNPWTSSPAWWAVCVCLKSRYRYRLVPSSTRLNYLEVVGLESVRLARGLSIRIWFNDAGYVALLPHHHSSTPSLYAVRSVNGSADAIVLHPPMSEVLPKGFRGGPGKRMGKFSWDLRDGEIMGEVSGSTVGSHALPAGASWAGGDVIAKSINLPFGGLERWIIDDKGAREFDSNEGEPVVDPGPADDLPAPRPGPTPERTWRRLVGTLRVNKQEMARAYEDMERAQRAVTLALESLADTKAANANLIGVAERLGNRSGWTTGT